jgi:hypothetical protein
MGSHDKNKQIKQYLNIKYYRMLMHKSDNVGLLFGLVEETNFVFNNFCAYELFRSPFRKNIKAPLSLRGEPAGKLQNTESKSVSEHGTRRFCINLVPFVSEQ